MRRYGLFGQNLRHPTRLWGPVSPMLHSPSRRPLRAFGCSPHCGFLSLATSPKPGGRPPPWLGQPLRCRAQYGTYGRRSSAGIALWAPSWRQRPGRSADLRRGRLGVAAMRRGGEPGARVLLPPVEAFRRTTHLRLLWAYQLVAQLGFERDLWVAPVDARRVKSRRRMPTRLPLGRCGRWHNGYPNGKPCPSLRRGCRL